MTEGTILVTGGAGFIGSNFLNMSVPDRPDRLFVNADKLTYAANLSNLRSLEGKKNYALERVDIGNREQVEEVVRREVHGGFFTVNLNTARAAFERLPWVRGANVRREWPARLDVVLEEHMPMARWGDEALVNMQGEVFRAAYDGDRFARAVPLPQFGRGHL